MRTFCRNVPTQLFRRVHAIIDLESVKLGAQIDKLCHALRFAVGCGCEGFIVILHRRLGKAAFQPSLFLCAAGEITPKELQIFHVHIISIPLFPFCSKGTSMG